MICYHDDIYQFVRYTERLPGAAVDCGADLRNSNIQKQVFWACFSCSRESRAGVFTSALYAPD